jgi:hypothetical protein
VEISGADTLAQKAKRFVLDLPGRKQSLGGQIPDDLHDRISSAAHGISQQVWGRYATPEQLQWLFDNGYHEPQQIHDVFGAQPHPHATGLTVDEFGQWSKAYDVMQRHR